MNSRKTIGAWIVAIGACLCAFAVAAEEQQPARKEALDPVDVKVIEAALTEFGRRDSLSLPRGAKTRTLYVADASLRMATELEMSDLRQTKWKPPRELLESLRERNHASVSLKGSPLPPRFPLVPHETLSGVRIRIRGRQPVEADPYVILCLPGYTRDRKRAIVRFAYGPTPHGAVATYLLAAEHGAWRVQEQQYYAYY